MARLSDAQAVVRLTLPELNVMGWAPVEGALGITAIRRVGDAAEVTLGGGRRTVVPELQLP